MSTNTPLGTVIITTHNRPTHLRNCLECLHNQSLSNTQFEIIVVDSYSDSHIENENIVTQINDKYNSKILYLHSKVIGGVTNSRNLAVSMANTNLIIQADDDSLPHSTYVEAAIKTLSREGVDIVVGKMTPKYESQPPTDLIDRLTSKYMNGYYIADFTVIDLGSQSIKLPWQLAFGSNCGFKKDFYIKAGGFGPDGFSQPYIFWNGSGEHNYTKKASEIFYTPEMHADHVISKERLKPDFFYARSFYYGINHSFDCIRTANPIFSKTASIHALRLLRPIISAGLRLNYFQFVRNYQYLLGFISHQFYCYKNPDLLEFCRRDDWTTYDFNLIKPFGSNKIKTQWILLRDK